MIKMLQNVILALTVALVIGLAEIGSSFDVLEAAREACKTNFENINTIEQMNQVIAQLRSFRENGANSRTIRKCLQEFDSIEELAWVINIDPKSPDVCHPDHVAKILDYHRRYMKSSIGIMTKKLFGAQGATVRHFFRRYALQVALTCRQNLVANIEQATTELNLKPNDFLDVMPWRQPETAVVAKENVDQAVIEERQAILDDVKNVFESVKTVDQLAWVLDLGSDSESNSAENVPTEEESETFKKILDDPSDRTIRLRDTCQRMAGYYEISVISIIRLSNAGYRWDADYRYEIELGPNSATNEQRQLVANWMSAIMVCHSINKITAIAGIEQKANYHQFARNTINPSIPFQVTEDFAKKFAWSKSQIAADKIVTNVNKRLGHMFEETGKLGEALGFKKAPSTSPKLLSKLKAAIDLRSGDRSSKGAYTRSRRFRLLWFGVAALIAVTLVATLMHPVSIGLIALLSVFGVAALLPSMLYKSPASYQYTSTVQSTTYPDGYPTPNPPPYRPSGYGFRDKFRSKNLS